MNIPLSALNTIAIIVAQLIIPGYLVGRVFAGKYTLTLSDAFFVGWVINVIAAMACLPFADQTQELAFYVRLFVIIISLSSLVVLGYRLDTSLRDQSIFVSLKRRLLSHKLIIFVVSAVLYLLFVVTHNIGFDDTAHLHYISDVQSGSPFPLYISLVENWEAARYPAFGLINGVLGSGIAGSGLFLYYFLGGGLLCFFLVKVFELIEAQKKNKWMAFGGATVVCLVLSVCGLDNFFNMGSYPLNGGKLLYLSGVLYILISWRISKQFFKFILGFSLIVVSFLHHLNLLLLFFPTLPLVLLFTFIYKRSLKSWLLLCCSIAVLGALILPGIISSENGILHYTKEVVVQTKVVKKKVIVEKPSAFQVFYLKVKRLGTWIKDGRYKNKYFKRAFSLDLLLIPCTVIFFASTTLPNVVLYFVVLLVTLGILAQPLRVIPPQLVVATFRSGTSFMLFDLMRMKGKTGNNDHIVTDKYTALYLKMFGIANVETLHTFHELLLFSPIFPSRTRELVAREVGVGKKKTDILKGRDWGEKTGQRWLPEEKSLEEFNQQVNAFTINTTLGRLQKIIKAGVAVLKDHVLIPSLFVRNTNQESSQNLYNILSSKNTGDNVILWRDIAIVPLSALGKGQHFRLKIDFEGENTDIVSQVTPVSLESPLAISDVKKKKHVKDVVVKKDTSRMYLIVQSDLGHFNGLGKMHSVKKYPADSDE